MLGGSSPRCSEALQPREPGSHVTAGPDESADRDRSSFAETLVKMLATATRE
jgi:uncharacterized protein YaiI (UPF0178 family)